MSADHEECPPPPSIPLLPPPPPPCSQFEAYGFGRWSRKEWGAAEAASGLFPEPYKSRLLSLCSCNKGPEAARCFVLAYQNAYALITNATVISSSLWASSPVAEVSAAPASTLPMTIRQLSSLNLPPLEILKICIDSTMTGKNIVFPWVNDGTTSTSYFIASSGSARTFNVVPRIHRCVWNVRPICAVRLPASSTGHTMIEPHQVRKGVVHVLSGESGSGKTTWALMTSDLGIYLTPKDFGCDLDIINNTYETNVSQKMARNSLSIAALHNAMKLVVGQFFTAPAEFFSSPVTLSLVLDAFGGHPTFVRGLCAADFADIRTSLSPLFNFAVELKLIVVGTGTDMKSNHVGIHPDTHVALRMPSTSMMTPLVKALNGMDKAATLIEALKSHAQAAHLIHNPRFAACLLKRLFDYCKRDGDYRYNEFIPSVEAARSCLDVHLFAATRDCKKLSALTGATERDIAEGYEHAVGLLLRKPHDCRQPGSGVADCAFWADVLPAGHVEVGGARTEETNRHGEMVSLILVAPETGRYAMSMAQHLLFRMGYGFDEFLPVTSWQRAEVMLAEYVSVLVSGLNGHKLRELLARLGMPEACRENAAVLEQTMSFGAVSTVHSGKWICPADRCRNADDATNDTGATREEFARLLLQQCELPIRGREPTEAEARKRAEGTAVVIVNAPGAPYAGVIVVIPRVAVILIQCKMLGDETEVVDIEADAEKLSGELTELNKMAGVPPGAYFRVLATNIATEKVPSDLHGLFVFTTSTTNNGLAPMLEWIQHHTNNEAVSGNEDVKVVRRMDSVAVVVAVVANLARPHNEEQSEQRNRKHARDE